MSRSRLATRAKRPSVGPLGTLVATLGVTVAATAVSAALGHRMWSPPDESDRVLKTMEAGDTAVLVSPDAGEVAGRGAFGSRARLSREEWIRTAPDNLVDLRGEA